MKKTEKTSNTIRMKKTGRSVNIRRLLTAAGMVACYALLAVGSVAIACSREENPVTAKIRQSLEDGQAAIEQETDIDVNRELTNDSDELVSDSQYDVSDQYVTSDQYDEYDPSDLQYTAAMGSVTAIGDSVMLGAAAALQDAIPGITVDAKESRQVAAACDIVLDMESRGTLGDTVVIALGTNGWFDPADGQDILDEIGSQRRIFWVLSYGTTWQDSVNSEIESLASANANVTVLDWPAAAAGHPEWFYEDGIHLDPDGQAGYAEFVRESIGM